MVFPSQKIFVMMPSELFQLRKKKLKKTTTNISLVKRVAFYNDNFLIAVFGKGEIF